MYTSLIKIYLRKKIDLKIEFLINIFSKINLNIKNKYILLISYIIINHTGLVLVAFLIAYRTKNFNSEVIIMLLIIWSSASNLVSGISDYKSAFMFPFEDLKILSLAEDKKIYLSMITVNLLFKLIFSGEWLFFATIIFIKSNIWLSGLILVLNYIVINNLLYLFANIMYGKYVYSILTRKIGAFRLFIYIINVVGLYTFIFYFTKKIFVYIIKRFSVISLKSLLDESFCNNLLQTICNDFIYLLKINLKIIHLIYAYLGYKSFIAFSLILLFLLYKSKIKLIPKIENLKENKKNDLFSLLHRYLILKSYRFDKCNKLIMKDQLNELLSYKWLFCNNFFQIVFLNYEAIAYLSLLTVCLIISKNNILDIQIIICMIIMVMANQVYGLRIDAYAYFSLIKEKEHLQLLKLSLIKIDEIFLSKTKILENIYFISVLVLDLYLIIIGIKYKSSFVIIIMAIIFSILLLKTMVLIQTHMIPIVTKFDYIDEIQVGDSFEEDEVADKLQEFPRIFLVIVPMAITFCMAIYDKIRIKEVIILELIYLFIAQLILKKYMKKIYSKGFMNIHEKII